jgi:hypothetical protein
MLVTPFDPITVSYDTTTSTYNIITLTYNTMIVTCNTRTLFRPGQQIPPMHCCHTVVTLLSHRCYTVVRPGRQIRPMHGRASNPRSSPSKCSRYHRHRFHVTPKLSLYRSMNILLQPHAHTNTHTNTHTHAHTQRAHTHKCTRRGQNCSVRVSACCGV